ncbi:MAG: hypothetical protein CL572_02745 [Alphaproteobacteria bacterium]|nr:hypothetical protein [Alphaproteobacteria bacterium]
MILSKSLMFEKKKNIHFVGIGGIGMSAIAAILSEKGFKVSGSDLSENYILKKLKKKKNKSLSWTFKKQFKKR